MRKFIFLLVAALFLAVKGWAQDPSATRKGNSVFVQQDSKNENAIKATEALINSLKEWAYWQVVPDEKDADFRIRIEISASKGMTLTSWGGTSYALVAKLLDKKGTVLWESNAYRSSPNGTNGFNSGKAVVRKLMRDLKKKYQ